MQSKHFNIQVEKELQKLLFWGRQCGAKVHWFLDLCFQTLGQCIFTHGFYSVPVLFSDQKGKNQTTKNDYTIESTDISPAQFLWRNCGCLKSIVSFLSFLMNQHMYIFEINQLMMSSIPVWRVFSFSFKKIQFGLCAKIFFPIYPFSRRSYKWNLKALKAVSFIAHRQLN